MLHFLRYALCVSQHNEALALTAGCARRSDSLHVSRLVPRTKRRWASDEARSEKLAGHITPGHKGFRASRWTDDKDSALRAAVADGLTDARIAADVLPGRTLQAIGKRRSSLKLGHFTLSDTASAEFVKRAQDRLRELDDSGRDARDWKLIEDEVLKEARLRNMPHGMIRGHLFPQRTELALMTRLRGLLLEGERPQMRYSISAWTADEDRMLRAAVADGVSDSDIATRLLPERTMLSVKLRRQRLSIPVPRRRPSWTDQDQQLLEESVRQGMSVNAIRFRALPHHTTDVIHGRRKLLKLPPNTNPVAKNHAQDLAPQYLRWTEDELTQLTDAAKRGLSNREIRTTLLPWRATYAIRAQRMVLGLPHYKRSPRHASFEAVDGQIHELVAKGANTQQILRAIPSLNNEKSVRTRLGILGLRHKIAAVSHEAKRWTESERALVFQYHSEGMRPIDIADRLKRTIGSVEALLYNGPQDWPISRKMWTSEESGELLRLMDERRTHRTIAKSIGRSVEAVRKRASLLKRSQSLS